MQILNYNSLEIVQIFVSVFFSIVFFQSGIDKIIDREGNVEFFKEHFKKTLIKNIVPFMLTTLTILELIAAGLCFFGFCHSLLYGSTGYVFYGLVLCGIVLLLLLFGQRIAKDYIGAADITIYFILCVSTIMSFK
tara:strand:- start:408 stop:812 length:405 start_codon:yes stop_codon:yes gene_type:complete